MRSDARACCSPFTVSCLRLSLRSPYMCIMHLSKVSWNYLVSDLVASLTFVANFKLVRVSLR